MKLSFSQRLPRYGPLLRFPGIRGTAAYGWKRNASRVATLLTLCVFAISALACGTVAAEETNRETSASPKDGRSAAAMIAALGDDSYRARRNAELRLLALGETARTALGESATSHTDLEVRQRSQQLLDALDALRARAYREALEGRLTQFLDDDNAGKVDYDFPGWMTYRNSVGSDRSARELFAQMQREEPELLRMAQGDAKKFSQAFTARSLAIAQSLSHPLPGFRSTITPGRAAAIYFVATNKDLALDARMGSQLYSLASQASLRNTLANPEDQKPLRKIIGNWVALDQSSDNNLAYYKVLLAMNHNLPEGRQAGLNLIKDEKAGRASYQFLQALMAIARFGSADDADAIEPLLKNNTVCQTMTRNGVTYTVQIRDAALATLIQLTGQDHADYGFDRLQKNTRSIFNTSTMGFPRDDNTARDNAIFKWRQWKERQEKVNADRKK